MILQSVVIWEILSEFWPCIDFCISSLNLNIKIAIKVIFWFKKKIRAYYLDIKSWYPENIYKLKFVFLFLFLFVCFCGFFLCVSLAKSKTKTDCVKNDCYMLFGLVNGFILILMLIVNTGLRLLYIIIYAYIHACIWQHFIIYMSSRHYNFLSPMIRCCSSTLKWH